MPDGLEQPLNTEASLCLCPDLSLCSGQPENPVDQKGQPWEPSKRGDLGNITHRTSERPKLGWLAGWG